MPPVWVSVLLSVGLVSLLGMVGVVLLGLGTSIRHRVLVFVVAMAAGTLLGDAMFHLFPEAVEARDGFPPEAGLVVLLGFFVFFLFEMTLRWTHAHGEAEHPHAPEPGPAPPAKAARAKPFGPVNLLSDGLHNFVDGALIGATYLVDVRLGVATTVAVAAHELPTEFGDFGVLLRAGIRPGRALLYNFLSALVAFAGAGLVLLLPNTGQPIALYGTPLIAGGFIYMAAADLVPELHHHAEGRYVPLILLGLVAGLGAMGGLVLIE